MGEVISYTKDGIDLLLDAAIVNGEVVDGDLVLTKGDDTEITIPLPESDSVVGSLEALPLYQYGHSFAVLDTLETMTPGGEYGRRVQRRLGMGDLTGHAASGLSMHHVANELVIGAKMLPADPRGVVIIDAVVNDVTLGGSAQAKLGFRNALRAALWLASSSRIELESGTFTETTGTWDEGAAGYASNGNWRGTADAVAEITGDYVGSDAALLGFGFLTPGVAAIIEVVKPDNTILATHDPNSQLVEYDPDSIPKVAPFTLPQGTNTIKIRKQAGQGALYALVDALLVLRNDAPTIVVVKDAPYRYDLLGGAVGSGTEAILAEYNAIIDEEVGVFPGDNVVVADPNVGWDAMTMVGNDDAHPNDRGMAHYADAVVNALKTLPFRLGQNTL